MISQQLPNIKGLIIDMDGVLYTDTEPLGDLPVVFDRIREQGLKFILATNNATRSVEEYHQKLARFGVTLEDWQIINTAQALGIYLNEKYPEGTSVYVVGQPSLRATIEAHGLTVVETASNGVKVVVASLDFSLTYEKLKQACLLIRAGCEFIGTNPDSTLPTPYGHIPGSGAVIGALEIATDQRARIIGKPEPLLYEIALKRLGLDPGETLAIGDRLETDIAGAQAAGIHTALVLTGASSIEEVETYEPKPTVISRSFTELIG